jgi:hypothetical protein
MEACEAGFTTSVSSNLDSLPSDAELGLWNKTEGLLDIKPLLYTEKNEIPKP